MDIAESCNKAADLLDERDLATGMFMNYDDGSVCALGAIGLAQSMSLHDSALYAELNRCPVVRAIVQFIVDNDLLDHQNVPDIYRRDTARIGREDPSRIVYMFSDMIGDGNKDTVIQLLRDVATKHQSDEYRSESA